MKKRKSKIAIMYLGLLKINLKKYEHSIEKSQKILSMGNSQKMKYKQLKGCEKMCDFTHN